MERAALLIVDVQNDFCPGGALAVPDGDRVVPVLNGLMARGVHAGVPVFASRDWHPVDSRHFQAGGGPWPSHCVAGSPGGAFHEDLNLPSATVVISKGTGHADDGYSAFEGTTDDGRRLVDVLRTAGVARLYVGGLATDYCVRASVIDACAAGFNVFVVTDAVAGLDADGSRRALDDMRRAGAMLVTSDAVDIGA